ncbi:methyltransferase [Maridesulfovibrio hydrothermalis]|uniref:O-methyltransferase family 2 n=1 Tax=Maridesulfovibrio hydrothermalis AM13 = DSM 14728 TaxID=1121451 RepID=L0R6C1_9BACT|nr:methyltransferase [Maridesulfovibrio hydrothermalis]CCO22248.1 O-methyltransferase family 2 [Maridesulfovibrio hydrothermalis AM13 = DSM 14728]
MWKDITVSDDGTHHQVDGSPIYSQRFDSVLTFHDPGLAPVRCGVEAWHIFADGTPAYSRRFMQTFGFYNGLAAVSGKRGWSHIYPDGKYAYKQHYAWCGNFQNERCSVRDLDGLYFHIDSYGKPLYEKRWRYAGDYYGNIAAVQGDDGSSTHIDASGKFVHNRWYIDLDVFHKGFARAREGTGWTHIRPDGFPAYERRFASVEPFYNGQARVECHDGALEVINEKGQTIQELRPPLQSEFASLSSDMVGFWKTKTIAVAVKLGVIEVLPCSEYEMADQCSLNVDGARRILHALGELNLVSYNGDIWQLTKRGDYLRENHPLTLKNAALEYAEPLSRMWDELADALSVKEDWTPPDIFGEVAQDGTRRIAHHQMLQSYALHDYPSIPRAMGLDGKEHIIDAAGGLGTLAKLMLAEYPNVSVTVLERPEVVDQVLKEQENTHSRLFWKVGDIFDSWEIGADAVVLSRVLHDWNDSDVLVILKRAREALIAGSHLFIVEMLRPESSFAGSLCDLHLLMATGGRERTEQEFAKLLDCAGFSLKEVNTVAALPSVLVGMAI